jgi:hypothetical protein
VLQLEQLGQSAALDVFVSADLSLQLYVLSQQILPLPPLLHQQLAQFIVLRVALLLGRRHVAAAGYDVPLGSNLYCICSHSELQSVYGLPHTVLGLVYRADHHSLGMTGETGLQDTGQPRVPEVDVDVLFAEGSNDIGKSQKTLVDIFALLLE